MKEDDEAPRVGRPRDASRDAELLDAALEVLGEVGYAGMTMDMVAARAKAGKATMYRRWPSKADLVLEALGRMKSTAVDVMQLPDTGTLRGDLLAMFKPNSVQASDGRLKVMTAIASMLSQDERFAEAVSDMAVTPFAEAHHALMQRALERKEISPDSDLETLSKLVAQVAGFRSIIEGKPFTRDFLVTMVDEVLMPALGVKRAVPRKRR